MADDRFQAIEGTLRRRKQRDLIRMGDEEVADFLTANRGFLQMSTMNRDGSIHMAEMAYAYLGGRLAVDTKARSQKVVNLRRNPQVSCLVCDGRDYEELRGVHLVGHAEIVEDPDRIFAIVVDVLTRGSEGFAYTEEHRPLVEQLMRNRVAIEIVPDRVVSWDHRKLAPPAGAEA